MSDLVLQFAQKLGQTNPLTQLGAGLGQIYQQQEAQRQAEIAQGRYDFAYNNYMNDPTPENLNYLYESGRGAGIEFGETQEQVGEYNSAVNQQEVEQVGEGIYAPLANNQPDMALPGIDAMIEANEAEGDTEEAQLWRDVRSLVEEGKTNEAMGRLGMVLGTHEEGMQFMENVHTMNQERRDALMTDAELIGITQEYDYPSESDRQRVMEAADGLPSGMGRTIAEMGSVISYLGAGGMGTDDIIELEQSLREEYNGYVEPIQTAVKNAEAMRRLIQQHSPDGPFEPTGALDTALIDLYNKVLDPNAVVRQSDALRTAAAQGALDRGENMVSKLLEGTTFSPETREEFLAVLTEIEEVMREEEGMWRTNIQGSLRRLWGDNEEEYERSQEIVLRGLAGDEQRPNRIQANLLSQIESAPWYNRIDSKGRQELRGYSPEQLEEFKEIMDRRHQEMEDPWEGVEER